VIGRYDSKRIYPAVPGHRINNNIRVENVRLVGEEGGPILISTKEALAMAEKRDLDLVEISKDQNPPVVKIIDYSKYKFELVKKSKESKKKQKVIHVKEIKFRPSIDKHDYTHKVNHARLFLEKGNKVKFTLLFRGREIMHKELGYKLLKDIERDLRDIIQVEKSPSMEGRNITMIVAPISSSKVKK